MFTGLIETVGVIRSITGGGQTARLVVDLRDLAPQVRVGESIAVNGVCLTVTQVNGTLGRFDTSAETLACSTLRSLAPMHKVNLERALKLDDRLGGHIVQGHVDGIATLRTVKKEGAFVDIAFTVPSDLMSQLVPKGSVAVDGISLTVADLDDRGFSVAVIPETARATTLGEAKVGDPVNIETDMIVKTVQRYLQTITPGNRSLNLDQFRQLGF